MNSLLMTAGNGLKVYEKLKTQTRRIVTLPHHNPLGEWEPTTCGGPDGGKNWKGETASESVAMWHTRTGDHVFAPYRVGEVRYIREPHYLYGRWKRDGHTKTGQPKYRFVADRSQGVRYPDQPPAEICTKRTQTGWFRRPGMFMFEWAARSFVKILSVRAERVQAISSDDVLAEGVNGECGGGFDAGVAFFNFMTLWDSPDIHGPGAWARNDWVWAVEFERVST